MKSRLKYFTPQKEKPGNMSVSKLHDKTLSSDESRPNTVSSSGDLELPHGGTTTISEPLEANQKRKSTSRSMQRGRKKGIPSPMGPIPMLEKSAPKLTKIDHRLTDKDKSENDAIIKAQELIKQMNSFPSRNSITPVLKPSRSGSLASESKKSDNDRSDMEKLVKMSQPKPINAKPKLLVSPLKSKITEESEDSIDQMANSKSTDNDQEEKEDQPQAAEEKSIVSQIQTKKHKSRSRKRERKPRKPLPPQSPVTITTPIRKKSPDNRSTLSQARRDGSSINKTSLAEKLERMSHVQQRQKEVSRTPTPVRGIKPNPDANLPKSGGQLTLKEAFFGMPTHKPSQVSTDDTVKQMLDQFLNEPQALSSIIESEPLAVNERLKIEARTSVEKQAQKEVPREASEPNIPEERPSQTPAARKRGRGRPSTKKSKIVAEAPHVSAIEAVLAATDQGHSNIGVPLESPGVPSGHSRASGVRLSLDIVAQEFQKQTSLHAPVTYEKMLKNALLIQPRVNSDNSLRVEKSDLREQLAPDHRLNKRALSNLSDMIDENISRGVYSSPQRKPLASADENNPGYRMKVKIEDSFAYSPPLLQTQNQQEVASPSPQGGKPKRSRRKKPDIVAKIEPSEFKPVPNPTISADPLGICLKTAKNEMGEKHSHKKEASNMKHSHPAGEKTAESYFKVLAQLKRPVLNIPDCAICHTPMLSSLSSIPCGHVFHITCLNECLASRSACPICREVPSDAQRPPTGEGNLIRPLVYSINSKLVVHSVSQVPFSIPLKIQKMLRQSNLIPAGKPAQHDFAPKQGSHDPIQEAQQALEIEAEAIHPMLPILTQALLEYPCNKKVRASFKNQSSGGDAAAQQSSTPFTSMNVADLLAQDSQSPYTLGHLSSQISRLYSSIVSKGQNGVPGQNLPARLTGGQTHLGSLSYQLSMVLLAQQVQTLQRENQILQTSRDAVLQRVRSLLFGENGTSNVLGPHLANIWGAVVSGIDSGQAHHQDSSDTSEMDPKYLLAAESLLVEAGMISGPGVFQQSAQRQTQSILKTALAQTLRSLEDQSAAPQQSARNIVIPSPQQASHSSLACKDQQILELTGHLLKLQRELEEKNLAHKHEVRKSERLRIRAEEYHYRIEKLQKDSARKDVLCARFRNVIESLRGQINNAPASGGEAKALNVQGNWEDSTPIEMGGVEGVIFEVPPPSKPRAKFDQTMKGNSPYFEQLLNSEVTSPEHSVCGKDDELRDFLLGKRVSQETFGLNSQERQINQKLDATFDEKIPQTKIEPKLTPKNTKRRNETPKRRGSPPKKPAGYETPTKQPVKLGFFNPVIAASKPTNPNTSPFFQDPNTPKGTQNSKIALNTNGDTKKISLSRRQKHEHISSSYRVIIGHESPNLEPQSSTKP